MPPPCLVIAFAAIGGRFVINGGGLGGDAGELNYWAPDSLAWEPMGPRHNDSCIGRSAAALTPSPKV